MAKRFIDTNFFKSPFVRGLEGALKGLYCFIICDSDGAGIWAADFEIASVYIGHKVTYQEFEKAFIKTGKVIDLNNGKYFFPDFIEHQYPQGLSEKNPAQKNFINELLKYDLLDEKLKIKKGLQRPFEGSKVMVMEKVEAMEMVEVMEMVKKEAQFNFKKSLLNIDGANEILVDDWMKVRKTKKATNTETAFKGFLIEFRKTGQSINEILEYCIVRSWAGFKYEWWEKEKISSPEKSQVEKYQDIIEQQKNFRIKPRGTPKYEDYLKREQ